MENTSKTKTKTARKRGTGSGRGNTNRRRAEGMSKSASASGGIGDWLHKTGQRVADARPHMSMPQLGGIETALENRPAVLGAVGLAIGMVIGAMLPSMGSMMHGNGSPSRSRQSTRH